ncbi:MAG: thrombospondin type 3 repeat-containing protein [Phycisphaerae bacterium]|nr:thrombospondin type 3 repeat-containing protein [Phycisphaerae bacterium]
MMSRDWKRGDWRWAAACSAFVVVAAYLVLLAQRAPAPVRADAPDREVCLTVLGGTLSLKLDLPASDLFGGPLLAQGHRSDEDTRWVEREMGFDVHVSTLTLSEGPGFDRILGGRLNTGGAIILSQGEPRTVFGNLSLEPDASGHLIIRNGLDDAAETTALFTVKDARLELNDREGLLRGEGKIALSPDWAAAQGVRYPVGRTIGAVSFEVAVEGLANDESAPNVRRETRAPKGTRGDQVHREGAAGLPDSNPKADAPDWVVGYSEVPSANACDEETASSRSPLAGDIGPDVIVADLHAVGYYGHVGGITAYAIGTYACNLGDERASWNAITSEHPAIIQNMYRLKDNEFSQIGMAWIKHGFYAVSYSLCGPCMDEVPDGQQLGVGCADPYSANLNSIQSNMSPRAQVNGYTGVFPFPPTAPPFDDDVDRRLQVHDADVDPVLNAGARYFIEGHYVMADDAAAGNSENNASYREIHIAEDPRVPDRFLMVLDAGLQTMREQPAVRAWKDVDPSVVETDFHVPGEGLFILAGKAIDLGTGVWRYRYTLQNLNSDRAAKAFSIPIPDGAVVSNIGFRDVEYHSGEPQSNADWTHSVAGGYVTWTTEDYSVNQNANALRFSTSYSFSFDANVEPATTNAVIDLFKPGLPANVSDVTIGPKLAFIDCNQNGVADECDVDCGAPDCTEPCGGSTDCNANGVPDECEPDCNENGIADQCDILNCPMGDLSCADCNNNVVPDECEPDCDEDGIPDACDTFDDTDEDGVPDCFDLCPLNTPARTCSCPLVQRCYFPSLGACLTQEFSVEACLAAQGIPPCIQRPCRQGCLLGDFEVDGDVDLADIAVFQRAFTGPGGFNVQDFTIVFDANEDDDIDLEDFETVFFKSVQITCPTPPIPGCDVSWITGPWESGPVPSLCP